MAATELNWPRLPSNLPGETHILLRPEYRHDVSDANFFSVGKNFRSSRNQDTLGLGAVFYF